MGVYDIIINLFFKECSWNTCDVRMRKTAQESRQILVVMRTEFSWQVRFGYRKYIFRLALMHRSDRYNLRHKIIGRFLWYCTEQNSNYNEINDFNQTDDGTAKTESKDTAECSCKFLITVKSAFKCFISE